MKKISLLAAVLLVFAAAAPLSAQTGCLDSPENPTAVLALAGSAGAFVAVVRNRLRRK